MDEQLALIELYEYKVADLLQGRAPRGGRRSVLELRDRLMHTELDAPLIRRLSRVDREFRSLKRFTPGQERPATGGRSGAAAAGNTAAVVAVRSEAPGTASNVQADELAAWNELQQLTWFREAQEKLNTLALKARSEPGHAILRVMYAVTETAERRLRGVNEVFPVPKSDDPLMSLGDREIALQLARTFSELLLSPAGEQALSEALEGAHAQPFPRHPEEDLLEARIQSAEREPMSPAAREQLIAALRAQYPQAADPRERPAVRRATEQLQELLQALLNAKPLTLGVPPGSILYSDHPHVGLAIPPEQAKELVIHLAGEGQDAYWHGFHLRWQEARGDWQFTVNNQLVLLRPSLGMSERHLNVQVGEELLSIYHTGGYVMLRHTLVPHESLKELARQAQVSACLMNPADTFAPLRLARAASRFMRDGRINAEEFTAASGLKYAGVDHLEMLKFARQGAAALTARSAQLPAAQLEEVFQSCAAASGVRSTHARALLRALQEVHVTTQEGQEGLSALHLPADGGFVAFQMPDSPVNLHFRDRTVTLNWDYKRDIAVLLPGGSAGATVTLHDVQVFPLGDLSLVLVRQQGWVAATTSTNAEG